MPRHTSPVAESARCGDGHRGQTSKILNLADRFDLSSKKYFMAESQIITETEIDGQRRTYFNSKQDDIITNCHGNRPFLDSELEKKEHIIITCVFPCNL